MAEKLNLSVNTNEKEGTDCDDNNITEDSNRNSNEKDNKSLSPVTRKVTNKIVEIVDDDNDKVSSRILGKRFDAINNLDCIKKEPIDDEYFMFNDNKVMDSISERKNAKERINSTNTSNLPTSTINASSNMLIPHKGDIEHSDTVPEDNLLGKRKIKIEPNDMLCTSTLNPSYEIPSIKVPKKLKSVKEEPPNLINEANITNEDTEVICIDDDDDDDDYDDDVVIIRETNGYSTSNILHQNQLSKEFKKSHVLNDLFLNNNNDNYYANPPFLSLFASSKDERSAFAKKLYNETRHKEGENDWENLEWFH